MMSQANKPASPRKATRKRTPYNAGAGRYKLHIEKELPGFHLRWIPETVEKLRAAEAAGYIYCDHNDESDLGLIGDPDIHSGNQGIDSKISRVVGTDEFGKPIRNVLMKQPLEFYEEDQVIDREERMYVEESIRGGGQNADAMSKTYGEVKVDR